MKKLALALSLFAAPAAAQSVWIVDASGGAGSTHATIQAAVTVAADGDTVLVREGEYAGFLLGGKGLTVIAEVGSVPHLVGAVHVVDVPATSTVVLRGLSLEPGALNLPGLRVEDCAGVVWVENCEFRGKAGARPEGAHVDGSARVSFTRCTLEGGLDGAGLFAEASNVVVHDSFLEGGPGAFGDLFGHSGGDGMRVFDGCAVHVAGSTLVGGPGGGADSDFDFRTGQTICGTPGDGGAGFRSASHPPSSALDAVTLLENVYVPGAPGLTQRIGECQNGQPGVPFASSASLLSFLDGEARGLRVGSPRREGEATTFTFVAQPGDFALALVAPATAALALPEFAGVLLVDPGFFVVPGGVVGAGGFVQLGVVVPPFADPTMLTATLFAQSAYLTADLGLRLGGPSELTILDASL